MKRFFQLLSFCLIAIMAQAPAMAAPGSIEVESAKIRKTDAGYELSSRFVFDLTSGLENAVTHGVPIYFTLEVEMGRPRWYWLDEKAVDLKQTFRISYNVLTRQYVAAIGSGIQQNFRTLDDALSLVRMPPRLILAEKDGLRAGQTYDVAVRMKLDISQLPKPFQVNAINNPDWQLSSGWKRFSYMAE
jgi:hypothetical protein